MTNSNDERAMTQSRLGWMGNGVCGLVICGQRVGWGRRRYIGRIGGASQSGAELIGGVS
jgi:hypothetical protein